MQYGRSWWKDLCSCKTYYKRTHSHNDQTVDSDVVVIEITNFHQLMLLNKLWIEFGARKILRFIPIHQIDRSLGSVKSMEFLFFHTFNGCDTMSWLLEKDKKFFFWHVDIHEWDYSIFSKIVFSCNTGRNQWWWIRATSVFCGKIIFKNLQHKRSEQGKTDSVFLG